MTRKEGIVTNNRNDGVHQRVDWPVLQALRNVLPVGMRNRAEEMVSRFSTDGQVAVSTVLIYAYAKGKLDAALQELEREWQNCFCIQDPELRGDPDCLDNLTRFAAVYDRIGVMPPWEERR